MSMAYYRASIVARLLSINKSWRCRENIVVFESDDWGAIRTSSSQAFHTLMSKGYDMKRSIWQLDSLETDNDLTALYEVLIEHKDLRGNPACFTGNIVMANPDFERIRHSLFRDYFIEDVSTTLRASSNSQNVTKLWREGIENRVFRPQLHAREHIRWWEWMAKLNSDSRDEVLETFDLNMCGVQIQASKEGCSYFEPVYISNHLINDGVINIEEVIKDGFRLFESQFGYRSLSTIAPFNAWTDEVEEIWSDLGIRYIQGYYCQQVIRESKVKFIPHYLGENSKLNALYLVRNCNFEPASRRTDNTWKKTLMEISMAFKLGIPAIVATHRVNYVGTVDKNNRKRNLTQLKQLLNEITIKWPDTQFLSSTELGYMIENDLHSVNDLEGLDNQLYPMINNCNAIGACINNSE